MSPGVDQEMSAATMEAAWRGAAAATAAQQEERQRADKEAAAAPQPPRPRGGKGKKRPGAPVPEGGPAPKQQRQEEPPPASQQQQGRPRLQGGGGSGPRRLATLGSGDAMMLDAELAAAEAAAYGAAFDAAAAGYGQDGSGQEDLSPTDVLTGLNRVRLNSIGSPRQQRRLTAAAAAAAVAPAGRKGRVRRGDSGVPMIVADLPGSPTAGAAQLLPPLEEFSDANDGAGAGSAVAAAGSMPTVKKDPPSWLKSLAVQEAAAAAAVQAPMPAPAPAPAPAQPRQHPLPPPGGRQHLATKSHKAVATSECSLSALLLTQLAQASPAISPPLRSAPLCTAPICCTGKAAALALPPALTLPPLAAALQARRASSPLPIEA